MSSRLVPGVMNLTSRLAVASATEETQTLETKIASRAELVVSGMATIPEAVKVFAPNVTVEVKTPDGTLGDLREKKCRANESRIV